MPDAPAMLATLDVEGLEADTLRVVECAGRDALSTPYAFTILCSSAAADLASRRMARRSATLRLESAGWKNAYSGLLFSFQKIRSLDKLTFYKATLAPSSSCWNSPATTRCSWTRPCPRYWRAC